MSLERTAIPQKEKTGIQGKAARQKTMITSSRFTFTTIYNKAPAPSLRLPGLPGSENFIVE